MNPAKISELQIRLERDGFKKKNGVFRGNCPWRTGSNSDGFTVRLNSNNGTAGWFDHVTEDNGKLSDLAAHYGIEDFEQHHQKTASHRAEYIYRDEAGKPVYKVIRGKDKQFRQMHYCISKKWVWGLGGNPDRCECPKITPLLFCLPELVNASDEVVIICEGEKDVCTAQKMGFIATCNSGGAGKWYVDSQYFKNRSVIIIADNDEPGKKHAADVAQSLQPVAISVKIIRFDGFNGYDLTDWVNAEHDGIHLQHDGIHLLDIIKDVPLWKPDTANKEDWLISQSPDDDGNALCVEFVYGEQFLYTDQLGWIQFLGSYWEKKGAEASLGRSVVDILKQRRGIGVQTENEKLVRAAKPSATNIRNCKYVYQDIAWTNINEFDNEPDLLNCKSGIVNLQTGKVTPHDPYKRFTYCININYNPQADETLWTDWLYETIIPVGIEDNGQYAELLCWLQMAVGYSLTGHTNEQCLFFLQGPPRAGKGIFLQILNRLLGIPLSSGVDFDTFTQKRNADNQNFDLAGLKACRLITASESERSTMLNAKRVKAITGNDPVYCAHKGKEFFNYIPQYKIWLSSNFKIKAAADDDALWSRLRIINFPNSHLGKEDFSLEERLWKHKEGILKWCVDGAIAWHQQKAENIGLGRPKIITQAAEDHRKENDIVQQYLDENCIIGESLHVVGAELSVNYNLWCKINNLIPLGKQRLGESLRQKGFEYKAKTVFSKTKKCWIGVKLDD